MKAATTKLKFPHRPGDRKVTDDFDPHAEEVIVDNAGRTWRKVVDVTGATAWRRDSFANDNFASDSFASDP